MTNRIRDVRKAKGLTLEQLAGTTGISTSHLSRMESNTRTVTLESLTLISQALSTPIPELSDEFSPEVVAQMEGLHVVRPTKSEVRPADRAPTNFAGLPRDIPVMGTAAGASTKKGAFQMTKDPIDYVLRPPGLLNARNIYSLFVEDVSMVPKFEPGDLIYVNPNRPPNIGDAVVIQEPDGEEEFSTFIKILERRTAEWINTRQFNPVAEIRFKNTPGTRVHRVMTTAELFGI